MTAEEVLELIKTASTPALSRVVLALLTVFLEDNADDPLAGRLRAEAEGLYMMATRDE